MKTLTHLLLLAAFSLPAWGAATIGYSSGSLNSAGTTVTITLSGVSGSCSPGSNVTGITVNVGGVAVAQSSAGCSGTTLTVVLNGDILSSETVTVDLSGSSNLTDGSGDTAIASSNNAVTNGSSLAGSLLNTGFSTTTATTTAFITQWDAAGGSPTHTHTNASQALIATTAHCSALDMYTYGGGQWKVILDGATGSFTSPGAGTWGWYRVYSGASDANHNVSVQNSGDFWFVTGQNNLRCVSSAPGLSLQSTDFAVQVAPNATGITGDGSPSIGSNSGYTTNEYWSGVSGLRFTTSSPSLSLFGYFCDLTALKVWQDGSLLSTVSVTNGCSIRTTVQVFSGQSGSHTYEITPFNGSNPGSSDWHLDALLLPAGQSISSSAPAARQTIGCYGDSICWGSGATQTDQIEGWLNTRSLNAGYNKEGNPGQQVCSFLQTNTSQITSISPSPAAVIFQGGVNDERASVAIGDKSTSGTFTYCVYQMLLNAGASLPSTTALLVRAILPYTETNASNRGLYIAAQQSATNSYNADKPAGYPVAWYYDTTNWLGSSGLSSDLVHPNATGYVAVNNLDVPVIASHTAIGKAYSLDCPGAGSATVGVGITCTVTLSGGATWTSLSAGSSPAETLNLTVSGITGTFDKTNPWNPATGENSDTFVFTPTSSGSGTISTVASQDAWADPAGVSVSAASSFSQVPPAIY